MVGTIGGVRGRSRGAARFVNLSWIGNGCILKYSGGVYHLLIAEVNAHPESIDFVGIGGLPRTLQEINRIIALN